VKNGGPSVKENGKSEKKFRPDKVEPSCWYVFGFPSVS
jgi:hypothetical protein